MMQGWRVSSLFSTKENVDPAGEEDCQMSPAASEVYFSIAMLFWWSHRMIKDVESLGGFLGETL